MEVDEKTKEAVKKLIERYPKLKIIAEVVEGSGNPYREIKGYVVARIEPFYVSKEEFEKLKKENFKNSKGLKSNS